MAIVVIATMVVVTMTIMAVSGGDDGYDYCYDDDGGDGDNGGSGYDVDDDGSCYGGGDCYDDNGESGYDADGVNNSDNGESGYDVDGGGNCYGRYYLVWYCSAYTLFLMVLKGERWIRGKGIFCWNYLEIYSEHIFYISNL